MGQPNEPVDGEQPVDETSTTAAAEPSVETDAYAAVTEPDVPAEAAAEGGDGADNS